MAEPGERPAHKYSPEYQKMLDAVPAYMEKHDIPEARYRYWEKETKKLLEQVGSRFRYFETGNSDLVDLGDELVLNDQATGYNIILNSEDMNITSPRMMIFYSCHISRSWHFGLLLAAMEKDKDIQLDTNEQVGLGIRGTRVEYGNWELVSEDEFPIEVSSKTALNKKMDVLETVETVLTIRPKDLSQSLLVASFLATKTRKEKGLEFIPGSWEINDIRATKALAPLLENENFSERFSLIVSNLYHHENGSMLLALREKTKFEEKDIDWKSRDTIQNAELVEVISTDRVEP